MLGITGYQGNTCKLTPERFQLKDLVAQAMEKKELSFIANETIKGDNLFGEELAASSKDLDVVTVTPTSASPGIHPRAEGTCTDGDLYTDVPSSFVTNSQQAHQKVKR